jgi:hypothetical protein
MLFIRVFGAVLLGFPVSEQQQRKHTPGPAPPTLVTVVVTRYAFMVCGAHFTVVFRNPIICVV